MDKKNQALPKINILLSVSSFFMALGMFFTAVILVLEWKFQYEQHFSKIWFDNSVIVFTLLVILLFIFQGMTIYISLEKKSVNENDAKKLKICTITLGSMLLIPAFFGSAVKYVALSGARDWAEEVEKALEKKDEVKEDDLKDDPTQT